MDEMDNKLLAALKRDGRASVSILADDLGITRATVRARMDKLIARNDIVGFTVVTAKDIAASPVRGLMMLGIEGRGTERTMQQLARMSEVVQVHSTNGTWDLIIDLGTETLEQLDKVLFTIRRMAGVTRSETNLLLSTRRAVQPAARP